MQIALKGKFAVLRLTSHRLRYIVMINISCVYTVISRSSMWQFIQGLDVIAAIITALRAFAKYVLKFGIDSGVCLDDLNLSRCYRFRSSKEAIASTIVFMLRLAVDVLHRMSSEEVLRLVDMLQSCIEIRKTVQL